MPDRGLKDIQQVNDDDQVEDLDRRNRLTRVEDLVLGIYALIEHMVECTSSFQIHYPTQPIHPVDRSVTRTKMRA
jgi:hypothetical protein